MGSQKELYKSDSKFESQKSKSKPIHTNQQVCINSSDIKQGDKERVWENQNTEEIRRNPNWNFKKPSKSPIIALIKGEDEALRGEQEGKKKRKQNQIREKQKQRSESNRTSIQGSGRTRGEEESDPAESSYVDQIQRQERNLHPWLSLDPLLLYYHILS